MVEFYQTGMGRKYYESDFPRMVKAAERIAAALEKIAGKAEEMAPVPAKSGIAAVFADRMRAIRQHFQMTPSDFANELGIEDGLATPGPDTLAVLVEMGVNVAWFLKGYGQMLQGEGREE